MECTLNSWLSSTHIVSFFIHEASLQTHPEDVTLQIVVRIPQQKTTFFSLPFSLVPWPTPTKYLLSSPFYSPNRPRKQPLATLEGSSSLFTRILGTLLSQTKRLQLNFCFFLFVPAFSFLCFLLSVLSFS